jgi:hypothetical protein
MSRFIGRLAGLHSTVIVTVSLCLFATATAAQFLLDGADSRWVSVVLYGSGAVFTWWGLARRGAEKRERGGVIDPVDLSGGE